MEFMKDFEEQDGIAFFLIYFKKREQYYYMTYREARSFFDRRDNGGRKSFRIDELNPEMFFTEKLPALVPYLDLINKDISSR
jgi:recombination protein U